MAGRVEELQALLAVVQLESNILRRNNEVRERLSGACSRLQPSAVALALCPRLHVSTPAPCGSFPDLPAHRCSHKFLSCGSTSATSSRSLRVRRVAPPRTPPTR